jgi:hypothetical protein
MRRKHWSILGLAPGALVLGILVGLVMVSAVAADPTPGGKIQMPRIDIGQGITLGADPWETWIQVQNVGTDDTGAIFFGWGEYSALCPNNDPGTIAHYCQLIQGNAVWTLRTQLTDTIRSAIVYAVPEDVFQQACTASELTEHDAEAWRCWVEEWESGTCEGTGGGWATPPGGQGEDLAVTVTRYGDNDYDTFVSSAYTGISEEMEGQGPPYEYFAPYVMKGYNGLDTELTIQNSGEVCTSVWIHYKQEGTCTTVYDQHIEQLAPGESIGLKVPNVGEIPCYWLGSAYITAGVPLGIVVDKTSFFEPCLECIDRGKLTTARVGPYDDRLNGFKLYGPMIFREISGWNTTVNVHNLSSLSETWVSVKFLDASGGSILSLSNWVCANGSTTFYLPASTDLGINYVGAVTIESLEREGTTPQPISAIVNMSRPYNPATPQTYAQGASYNAIPLSLVENVRTIALPFLANDETTSAIGIRNNNDCNRLAAILDIYDDTGLLASVPISIDPEEVEYVAMNNIGVPMFTGSGILGVSVEEVLCGEEVPGAAVPMPSVIVVNTGIGTGDIVNVYEGIVAEVTTPIPTVTATPTPTATPTSTPTPTVTQPAPLKIYLPLILKN